MRERMTAFDVSFSMLFPKEVPSEVKAKLRARLGEVGTGLESLPADGILWDSIVQSEMRIDIGDWRFIYTVDRENNQLAVTKALHLGH